MYQDLLNESSFLDKQIILIFTKLDRFSIKIKKDKYFKLFQQSFSNYKDGKDSTKILNYIKDQYHNLTKDSLRKKVISFECNLLDQVSTQNILEKIFKLTQ